MDLQLTDEQREVQSTLRRLLAQRCPPALIRLVKDGAGDEELDALWGAAVDAGVLGLGIDATYGGGGGSLVDVGLVAVEAGRALLPPVVTGSVLFGLALHVLGDDAMRERWLPRVCAGDTVGAVVVGRTHEQAPFVAEQCDDHWVVTGRIGLVLVPERADTVLVRASDDAGRPVVGVIDTRSEAVRRDGRQTMGTSDLCDLTVAGAELGVGDAALASESALHRAIAIADALGAAAAVGGAEAVLERTATYVTERVQFGRPIGSFQAPQHHVANVSIAIDGARLLALETLWGLDAGELRGIDAELARAVAASTFKTATLRAHQLHGGLGMTLDSDLHLWSERAKLLELLGVGSDDMLDHLADHLWGAPAGAGRG